MKPTDILAVEKSRRDLQRFMPMFQAMDNDTRQKAFVVAAWTFVRDGDVEEALKLVDLLTPEYVRDVMPLQMATDPAFDQMAEIVANALVEANVHIPSYTPTSGQYVAPSGLA